MDVNRSNASRNLRPQERYREAMAEHLRRTRSKVQDAREQALEQTREQSRSHRAEAGEARARAAAAHREAADRVDIRTPDAASARRAEQAPEERGPADRVQLQRLKHAYRVGNLGTPERLERAATAMLRGPERGARPEGGADLQTTRAPEAAAGGPQSAGPNEGAGELTRPKHERLRHQTPGLQERYRAANAGDAPARRPASPELDVVRGSAEVPDLGLDDASPDLDVARGSAETPEAGEALGAGDEAADDVRPQHERLRNALSQDMVQDLIQRYRETQGGDRLAR